MKKPDLGSVQYSIFDPTGNITALVESPADEAVQMEVAAEIMRRHPEVEQVGFVRFYSDDESEPGAPEVSLIMAGGEFCGIAALSAAALYIIRHVPKVEAGREYTVLVQVSGASDPVRAKLSCEDGKSFRAEVEMPAPIGIEEKHFVCEADWLYLEDTVPIVHMEGIDHIIADEYSVFYQLRGHHEEAEMIIKDICKDLGSKCLGMMFVFEEQEVLPLVYVPGADTIFWENSCASGTAAIGAYLAFKKGKAVDVTLSEPGGRLSVASDPDIGVTRLRGNTRMLDKT